MVSACVLTEFLCGLEFDVCVFVMLFVCFSLFIDPPIAPPIIFYSLLFSLLSTPYLGGVLWWVWFRACFGFCLDAQNQVISEEQEEVKMLNWKNFGEKRKEV